MQKNYRIVACGDVQTLIAGVNLELSKGGRVVGSPFLMPAQNKFAMGGPSIVLAQALVEDTEDAMREQLAGFVEVLPAALAKLGIRPAAPDVPPPMSEGGER